MVTVGLIVGVAGHDGANLTELLQQRSYEGHAMKRCGPGSTRNGLMISIRIHRPRKGAPEAPWRCLRFGKFDSLLPVAVSHRSLHCS
jgi:hypothetical protein